MNNKLIYVLTVFAFLAVSCGQNQQSAQRQRTGPAPAPVVTVPAKNFTGYSTYPVRIKGTINSEVRAKVSGYIKEVLVDEGQWVRKGQPLFKLETRSLSGNLNASKANIKTAQVKVNQLKPLVEKGIISNVELESAKAQLEQAKANYESIAANIGYSNIKSPISGFVGSILFRQGSLVGPSSQPLTNISSTGNVYAYFSMNETDYLNFLQNTEGKNLQAKIKNFPPVQLRLSNGEIYPIKGEIQTVNAQIDPTTGTVSFRAGFNNPNHLLADGSSGSIMIPQQYKEVPAVPALSTYKRQGKTYVYKVFGDTIAKPQIITVTATIDNYSIVKTGLKAGDQIIAKGAESMHGSTPVKPIPTPADSVAEIKPVF